MADTFDYEKMAEAFTKAFGGGGGAAKPLSMDPKSVAEFKKSIADSTKALKEQNSAGKAYEAMFRGQMQATIDHTKELDELDKQISELAKTAKGHNDDEAIYALQQARREKATEVASLNARASVMNLGVTVGNVATSMIKSAFQYAKDLQSGASGVEAGTGAAERAVRTTGDAVSGLGSVMSGLSSAAALLPGPFKYIGIALGLLGPILDIFGKKAADVSEAGLKALGDELKNTQKSFKTITDAGAVFGGGMTEMRNVAASAGLDLAQLSTVVKNSREDLTFMGMGMGEATKRIAGVSKELRTSELGIQLRKLGYSAEEQAELAAGLMANQRAANAVRIQSDAEVAKQTALYGRDLKVLADITGQDAKKAAEKARMQAMQADIMAKLGPAEAEKFQAMMRAMPEAMHKGILQQMSSGTITDVATNIMKSQQPAIGAMMDNAIASVRDVSKTASDVQQETLEARGRIGELERARIKQEGATINMVATVATNASAAVTSTAEMQNQLLLQTQFTTDAAKKTKETADAAANNMKPLDVAVAGVEENAQKLRAALGAELTGHITTYAKTLAAGTETVAEALGKMGINTPGSSANKKEDSFFRAPTAGELTTITSLIGGIIGGGGAGLVTGGMAAVPGAMGGAAAGGAVGEMLSGLFNLKKGFAGGGIAKGPESGYFEKLHGTEAVIPLPNGKSVPLDLDMSSITRAMSDVASMAMKASPLGMAAGAVKSMFDTPTGSDSSNAVMQEQVNLLREIREVLTNSKDLQQQYVYNTYN